MKFSIAELQVIYDTLHNSLRIDDSFERIFTYPIETRKAVRNKIMALMNQLKIEVSLDVGGLEPPNPEGAALQAAVVAA